MKRGFTLVELLAVIVILAIILTIAVPSITSIVDNSRLNSFNVSSDMLERAANTYINANNITVASGSTSQILYSDIKSAGYMNKIVDPISNNECIYSRVYVTNTSGVYTYKGALVCDNYMDIDAYNLVTNGDFSNGTTGWSVGTANTTMSISNEVMLINCNNPGNVQPRAGQKTPLKFVGGKKIYFYSKSRTITTNSQKIGLRITDNTFASRGTYVGSYSVDNPTQNQWYTFSAIQTMSAGYESSDAYLYIFHQYADTATSIGKTMETDDVYAFDLTSIYGAGNEPSDTQMGNIMSNMGK